MYMHELRISAIGLQVRKTQSQKNQEFVCSEIFQPIVAQTLENRFSIFLPQVSFHTPKRPEIARSEVWTVRRMRKQIEMP